jgi:hypothetical protein
MLMATTDFHPSRIQQSIRRMLVRKVDGVALIASEIETEPIEIVDPQPRVARNHGPPYHWTRIERCNDQ